jgi:hypothetical protein
MARTTHVRALSTDCNFTNSGKNVGDLDMLNEPKIPRRKHPGVNEMHDDNPAAVVPTFYRPESEFAHLQSDNRLKPALILAAAILLDGVMITSAILAAS